ncbi:MFS transporter [Rhodococcus phenolicus]|uniref:MFS transporter n=1 Tax=Rhodococcus phenolicus TaxID=263849 RepID=UPI00147159A1|nr:MFS transporter [Rhodococcus phenolicus]
MHDLVGSAYFPVSALARLPLSMLVMGVLTYVVASTSDFASAGIAAAVTGVGVAVGAPLSGIASDRWGQRPTLLVSTAVYVLAVIAVLVAGDPSGDAPALSPDLLAAAFAAGIVVPQCGPMTRVRWIRGLSSRGSGHAVAVAQGFEGTMDELGFVLGPAAVGIVAALFGAAVPLYVLIALTVIVVPWFALHPSAQFAAPADGADSLREREFSSEPARVSWAPVSVLLLGMLGIGTIFGSLATTTAVFADETGHPGSGGLIYAALGLTSGAAALSVSRWSERLTASARWSACAVMLVAALALMWLPSVPWQMVVVLLFVGAPIGPILVTIFKVAGDHTPARRLGFIMTLLSAGITLGTSIGNWVGGEVANAGGHSAAIWVAFGAGVSLLVCGVLFTVVRFEPVSRASARPAAQDVLEPLG